MPIFSAPKEHHHERTFMRAPSQEHTVSSQYFAPRGKERLIFLGEQIARNHLHYNDRLIGLIGDAGSGKSSLLHGMFPGLQLTNDDNILDPQKIMQIKTMPEDLSSASTFHIDMRFQTAFTQMFEIIEFVERALSLNKRVVVEHFNLLYKALGMNADINIAIGEEIIVTRPSLFGPDPESIYQIVHDSLKYRKMAHTAEELTIKVLCEEMGFTTKDFFCSDIRNGFVLRFFNSSNINFDYLENRIKEYIQMDLQVSYYDENHIMLGDNIVPCDGPRIHVKHTSVITQFSLVKEFLYDPKSDTYCLIGVLDDEIGNIYSRNTDYFFKRNL